MTRTARHLSLHRIDRTELRVVSDVEAGILPMIQAEEDIIRRYQAALVWPHRWVTLLILQDMLPLVRQLYAKGEAGGSPANLPPGGTEALEARPVVNAYDLADLSACTVFVNQQAMRAAGYWGDPLAVQGLLAHEHAHPLAENDALRASRQVRLDVSSPIATPVAAADPAAQIAPQVTLLAEKLVLYGPREVAANELALRCGFADALAHLDRSNMAAARRALAGRAELRARLQGEQLAGRLAAREADTLLLLADLRGYADWAFEIAAFVRAGELYFTRELEAALQQDVFPHLAPEVPRLYAALAAEYSALRFERGAAGYISWGRGLLQILSRVIKARGIDLHLELRHAQEE
jgi:hypothetical protein